MKMKVVGFVGKSQYAGQDIFLYQCPNCKKVELEGFANEEHGPECDCDAPRD